MRFKDYLETLDEKQLEAFAREAGTTVDYIRTHLISGRKTPRKPLMEGLAKATRGHVSYQEVLSHFYPPIESVVNQ